MIPHSRKDASGRSQLSKAEGELAFKLWQKGDKGGRGGRGQKEEGGRIEAKKRTWEAFKKCYSYKLTAITIHQPFPLIISLLFKRFIYLIRYLIFINHIKSGGVPDYLRAVHTHTHTHTHTHCTKYSPDSPTLSVGPWKTNSPGHFHWDALPKV